jgi:hypothetical protein
MEGKGLLESKLGDEKALDPLDADGSILDHTVYRTLSFNHTIPSNIV